MRQQHSHRPSWSWLRGGSPQHCVLWGAELAGPEVSIHPQLGFLPQQRLGSAAFQEAREDWYSQDLAGRQANCAAQSLYPPFLHSQEMEHLPIPGSQGCPGLKGGQQICRILSLVCSSCFTLFLGIERRACFPFFNSAGQTPPLGRFQRDQRLHLVITKTCLAPRAWSKIRNLTHYFHITLTRLQEFSHPQSLFWEAKVESVLVLCCEQQERWITGCSFSPMLCLQRQ